MTSFTNRVCQTLHDEHAANLVLLERLERLISHHGRALPSSMDPAARQLLSELRSGMASEVKRHFDFEENELFPYLGSVGESAIGAHLAAEHAVLRPLITQLSEIAQAVLDGGFDAANWREFQRVGMELRELLSAHIQKEEMLLLPVIEGMDSETALRLYQDYMENV